MGENTRSQRHEKKAPIKQTKGQMNRSAKKLKRKQRKWYVKLPVNVFKFIMWSIVLGVVGIVIGASLLWGKFGDEVSNSITEGFAISKTISKEQFEKVEPTKLYDKDNNLIKELKERNFQYLSFSEDDELYKKISDTVVSIEDERFYRHKGFDYYGVVVSGVSYALGGGELRGASTITQQLVKNTYLSQEQTMTRKIKEAVIAQELEKKFSKREILEFYVNDNYYGNGQYGLATASQYYYGKPVADLSVGELAVLTGIPNNPTIYDPINQPENSFKKRNVILGKMLELKKIDEKTYAVESQKKLTLNVTPSDIDNSITKYDQSFALFHAVENVMKANGFRFEYWFDSNENLAAYQEDYDKVFLKTREDILKGGYVIETSIDSQKQDILQQAVDNGLSGFFSKNEETGLYLKQASATTIDNKTNEVVAIVGGRSQEGNTYNRAYLGARQPGSAMKPFLAYAPAFENGYVPQSIIEDRAITNGPKNWYSGYKGNVSIQYALDQSINTIAYRLMDEAGTKKVMKKLSNMEFRALRPEDNNPITAVGGFTQGVTTAEMTSAMATLVNGGQYVQATNVRKITKSTTDEVVYDKSKEQKKQIYEDGASYLTLEAMKGVVDNGTGKSADWGYKNLGGKTGTTDGNKDLWFTGTTPHYSTSVWVGDDIPSTQGELSYITQGIFRNVMKQLHVGKSDVDFAMPNSVYRRGNLYYHNKTNSNEKQDTRLKEEKSRKANELQAQKTRLTEQDYRIIHGLSKSEEESRERKAQSKIQLLKDYTLYSVEDFDKTTSYYNKAIKAIELVKHQRAFNQLTDELEIAMNNKRYERDQIAYRIALEKQQKIDKAIAEQKAREDAIRKAEQEKEDLMNQAIEEELRKKNEEDEARYKAEQKEAEKQEEAERQIEEARIKEQQQEEEDRIQSEKDSAEAVENKSSDSSTMSSQSSTDSPAK